MNLNPKKLKGKRIDKFRLTGFNVDGFPMGKFRGFPILVRNGIPGEIVDIQLNLVREMFAEATIEKIHQPSAYRQKPECEHFGVCGGCNWMHMSYEYQLAQKMDNILYSFTMKNSIVPEQSLPIIPCKELKHYRNKAEYTFSANRWFQPDEPKIENPLERLALGYHVPNWFEKVFDIQQCPIVLPIAERIRLFIRHLAIENKISFFDFKTERGLLKNLTVRVSSLNEVVVIIGFNINEPFGETQDFLMATLWMNFPEIKSVFYTLQQDSKPILEKLEYFPYKNAHPYFHEDIDGYHFRIHAKSFFQTNLVQTPILYKKIKELSGLQGHEVLLDLYCGTGTIGIYLADRVSQLIGMDHSATSIEDAVWNAQKNNINNASFYCGDIFEQLSGSFFNSLPTIDIIVIDPPRGGLKKGLIPLLLKLNALKIVYISCNPITQAWDIEQMLPSYRLTHMQAIDMFPNTHHVENICILEKNLDEMI